MLFECLQDVLGGRTGFFLAVRPSILINMIWCLCDWWFKYLHADDFSYDSKTSNQVNSYLVDVTSENTRTARLFNEIEITHVKSKTCPPLKNTSRWKCINNWLGWWHWKLMQLILIIIQVCFSRGIFLCWGHAWQPHRHTCSGSCELNLKIVKNISLHNQRRPPLGLLLFLQLTPDSVWQRWSTWSSLSRFHSWFVFFAFGVYCPYSSGFILLPLIWFDYYTCWMSNLNVQDSIELVSEDRRSAILQERRKNLSKCKQGFRKGFCCYLCCVGQLKLNSWWKKYRQHVECDWYVPDGVLTKVAGTVLSNFKTITKQRMHRCV